MIAVTNHATTSLRPLLCVLCAAAAITGCGDSLLGEVGVNEPLGLEDPPSGTAWEVRWFVGEGDGLVAPCALYPLSAEAQFTEEQAAFGYLDAPAPELADVSPAATIEGDDYDWSLGLALLVESTDGERAASEAEPEAGVLGLAVYQALLRVEGDLEAFADDLLVWSWDHEELEPTDDQLVSGMQFVDLSPWEPATSGSFVGSMSTPSFVGEGLLMVDSLDIVESSVRPLWRGEPIGGILFEDCD
jgi:hypothetical protein